jgi:two-component system response regulator HydG
MSFKNSQIWIVDDDLKFIECIKTFFDSQSFITRIFDCPDDLLKDFRDSKIERPHLILSDLHFPETLGFELLKEIKAIDQNLPVIIMTGDDDVDVAVQAVEAGAYDFVLKPLHLKKLLISVERALKQNHSNIINDQFNQLVMPSLEQRSLGIKGVIGNSPKMLKVFDLVKRVAPSTATVCISGESGTGKEVIAKCIHELSPRASKPFVAINCSAIPENLLESELFGHAKGAFTGAIEKKLGLFETANGGTLFLDEIAELSLPLQAKLLRVVQERKVKRVGENTYLDIDVRILTATHADLKQSVGDKTFREDLYYRLNLIPIHLPPLRERKEDIYPLANFFLTKLALLNKTMPKKLSPEALQFLYVQEWRGNVRELENSLERATVLCEKSLIEIKDLMLVEDPEAEDKYAYLQNKKELAATFFSEMALSSEIRTLDEISDLYIQFVLSRTAGVKDEAAKLLGIDRKTLYRRMVKLQDNDKTPRVIQ